MLQVLLHVHVHPPKSSKFLSLLRRRDTTTRLGGGERMSPIVIIITTTTRYLEMWRHHQSRKQAQVKHSKTEE